MPRFVCLLLAFSVHASCLATPQAGPRFRVGKETTVITEPVDDDGYVNYSIAMDRSLREGVTPENNANVVLRRLLGNREISAGNRIAYYKQLGIPEPPDNRRRLVDQGDMINEFGNGAVDEFNRAMAAPWKAEELPIAAEWIERNTDILVEIREGAARPKYYSPVHPSDDLLMMQLLPDAQGVRSFTRLLIADAMLNLGNGNEGTALEDLLACRRLAGHLGNSWTLIENLVSFAISNMTADAEEAYLNHARPGAGKMAFWRRKLKTVRTPVSVARTVNRSERYVALDAVMALERGRNMDIILDGLEDAVELDPAAKAIFLFRRRNPKIDFNRTLTELNKRYDRIVEVLAEQDAAKRVRGFAELDETVKAARQNVSKLQSRLLVADEKTLADFFTDLVYGGFGPSVNAGRLAELRARARLDVIHVGWSLSAYRADHDAWPASLDALVPKYIDEVPVDRFDGKPLRYKVDGRKCIAYSVGRNMKDDGGARIRNNPQTWDIVVELSR